MTQENQYFWSLLYWFLKGRPERMDADGDGVPCETLYPAALIADVWNGGAVR